MEYQKIVEEIKESPILLIGIGNELQIKGKLLGEEAASIGYAKKLSCLYHQADGKEELKEYYEAYGTLKKLVQGKDYFIITTNTDAMLEHMGFDAEHLVSPCGSVFRMQCEEAAHGVWDVEDSLLENMDLNCPVCQKPGRLNLVSTKPYNELGYQQQWEKYTRWLQRTINKKIFLLELGEGFETPTVIRWPFEKIAYVNQKATFARVNHLLPQLSEEIRERAFSVKEDSLQFLGKISELLNE